MEQQGKGFIFLDNRIMENKNISGLDNFMHENQMWERALNLYRLENALLKTRLSQVVDKNADKDFVNIAEDFHNRLLFTDEHINELFVDLRRQKQLIKRSASGSTLQDNFIAGMQDKLRTGMENFEKDITILRNDFNTKLIYPYC
jgi:hypothetical protein